MPFNLIPIIIIIGSLAAIIFIVGKKLPQLRLLNTGTITEEKESQAKRRILEERLVRKSTFLKRQFIAFFKPVAKAAAVVVKKIYNKINALEKEYQEATISRRLKITNWLTEASNQLAEQNLEKAEECYIKVIELDNRNLAAYQGLGELYLLNKDYKKAKESLEYVVKLLASQKRAGGENEVSRLMAEGLAKLGLVNQAAGDLNLALIDFKKAVAAEPNNPKYLDLLLKICIILKDKTTAKKTLAALKQADPENQKLAELEKEVGEI